MVFHRFQEEDGCRSCMKAATKRTRPRPCENTDAQSQCTHIKPHTANNRLSTAKLASLRWHSHPKSVTEAAIPQSTTAAPKTEAMAEHRGKLCKRTSQAPASLRKWIKDCCHPCLHRPPSQNMDHGIHAQPISHTPLLAGIPCTKWAAPKQIRTKHPASDHTQSICVKDSNKSMQVCQCPW